MHIGSFERRRAWLGASASVAEEEGLSRGCFAVEPISNLRKGTISSRSKIKRQSHPIPATLVVGSTLSIKDHQNVLRTAVAGVRPTPCAPSFS